MLLRLLLEAVLSEWPDTLKKPLRPRVSVRRIVPGVLPGLVESLLRRLKDRLMDRVNE